MGEAKGNRQLGHIEGNVRVIGHTDTIIEGFRSLLKSRPAKGSQKERQKRWLALSRHRFGLYKWSLCRLMG